MTTYKIKMLLFLILLSGMCYAQQTRHVENFSAISVHDLFSVVLKQDSVNSITIQGDSSSLPLIKTEVSGGKLSIFTDKNIRNSDEIKIYVSAREIREIEVSGAATVKTENKIKSQNLALKATGAGDIKADLETETINLAASGSGDITLSGTTKTLAANVSGAGDIKAFNLLVDDANVKASGAGDLKLNVKSSIKADVSGAGSVIYRGDPQQRDVQISGAGSVRQSSADRTSAVDDGDTTKFQWGKRRFIIIDDNDTTKVKAKKEKKERSKVKDIWSGFEIGINGYLTKDHELGLPNKYEYLDLNYRKSIFFNLNFYEGHLKLYKNYVALTTGLGFAFNRYMFSGDYTIPTKAMTWPTRNYALSFKKNLLKSSYLTLPLFLQLNSNSKPKKSFHLALGVVLGYNLGSQLKQVYDRAGVTYKLKAYDTFNLNPIKVSPSVRFGYGNFNAFASYSLTSLFKQSRLPELHPFTVGVRLIGF